MCVLKSLMSQVLSNTSVRLVFGTHFPSTPSPTYQNAEKEFLNCSHFRFQGSFRKVLARCSEKGRKSDLSRKIKKSTKFHLRSKQFFFFRFYFAVVEINAALVLLLITSLL